MDPQKFITKILQPVENVFSKYVSPVIDIPLVSVLISWLVVVNIVFTIEELPVVIKKGIKHTVSKVVFTFIGVYMATKDFYLSIISTILLMGLYFGLKMGLEKFELVWPETDTVPGCGDVKVSDLLALFDGDKDKLKRTMYSSGVPLDLQLNDTDAPLIATYLINFGHKVTDGCKPPM